MSDYGTVIGPGAVRFQRLLPGPIERVWEYITDSEKRATWLAAGPMELKPGARFELHFKHSELSPHQEETPEKYRSMEGGATFGAEITACEPPRLLSHTWGEAFGAASEVTYELKPQGSSVLLVLTHRRLDREGMLEVSGGWHAHLDILQARINGQTPPPFWKTHARLEREYAERFAAADAGKAMAGTPQRRSA
jgi:uncharacterized protein YndB with AHSA1/START domain